MKIANRLAIVSSLVLAAGCAHHDKTYSRYQYNEGNPSYSSSPTMTTPSGAATEQTTPSTGFGTSAQSSTTTPERSTTGQTSTGLTTTPTQGLGGDADRSLTSQVQQSLYNDPSLATLAPNIQITAQGGTVTLTGNVKDEQQKQRIESMVKNTTGVVTVNNQLQVSSRSELTPTGETSGKFSSTDTQNQGTSSTAAKYSSTENQQGTTTAGQQPGQTDQTTGLASSTTGQNWNTNQAGSSSLFGTNNQSISGSLVPPTPTSDSGSLNRIYSTNQTGAGFSGTDTNSFGFSGRIQGVTETDKTLGHQIMQQLRSDTSLMTSLPMIRMSIDNGKVTLTGTVNSDQDKKSIETAVQGISGVATVDNQLQVKGATGTENGTNPNSTPTPNSNPNP